MDPALLQLSNRGRLTRSPGGDFSLPSMGKPKGTDIEFEHSHPGCMWGMFHILKYQQWHYVKKKFPQFRHPCRIARSDTNDFHPSCNLQFCYAGSDHNSIVQQKKKATNSSSKHTVKSRIKALIADDKSRRKNKHKRSSTSPAELQLIHNDCNSKSHDEETVDHIVLTQSSPRLIDQKCESFTMVTKPVSMSHHEDLVSCYKLSKIPEEHDQVHAMNSPVSRTNDLKEPLDINKINKELVLKILHEAGNLPYRGSFNHRLMRTKLRLPRSSSFPVFESLEESISLATDPENKQGKFIINKGKSSLSGKVESLKCFVRESVPSLSVHEFEIDKASKLNQEMASVSNADAPGPMYYLKNQGQSQQATKRFKRLKQKLKQAMKTSKKETQRITMDGVLDKIPHGNGLSAEMKEQIKKWKEAAINKYDESGDGSENEGSVSSINSGERRSIRRTPSLDGSLDKYCRLYEAIFNEESKEHLSEESKTRYQDVSSWSSRKSLGRIFSLPELKSYSPRSDESPDRNISETSIRNDVSVNEMEAGKFDDGNIPSGVKNQIKLEAATHDEVQKHNSISPSVVIDQMPSTSVTNLQKRNDASFQEKTLEQAPKDFMEEGMRLSPIFVPDIDRPEQDETSGDASKLEGLHSETISENLLHDAQGSSGIQQQGSCMDIPPIPESKASIKNEDAPNDHLYDELLDIPVNLKDLSMYHYVKDVLVLAGFCETGSAGVWHSDDQPLDPSMYEEVEHCFLVDPDYDKTKKCCNCDQLLLFDLINEALVHIYQRSFSYFPMTLSPLCNIRPTPVGEHVLEEVWATINLNMSLRPAVEQPLEYTVRKDMEKHDGWMNLQFDSECVGLEVEDLIFDELLEELIWE